MTDDIATSLPDLPTREQTVYIVDTGDAGAVINGLVVQFFQVSPGLPQKAVEVTPIFAYGPSE